MTESCRLITTEQYQEYLKLKEEHKPLNWEELKEEAKKMGAKIIELDVGTWCIEYKELTFFWNGTISTEYSYYDTNYGEDFEDDKIIAEGRNADQMLAIMKALQ